MLHFLRKNGGKEHQLISILMMMINKLYVIFMFDSTII